MPKTKKQKNNSGGAVIPRQGIPGNGLVQPPPYHGLSKTKERRAIKLGQAYYRIIKRFAARAANRHLVKKGHPSAAKQDFDFQKTMSIIKKKVQNNPLFLVSPMTGNQLQDVSKVRNYSDHDCLPELLIDEAAQFAVLKEFCNSVGDNSAAIDVQRICNSVSIHDFSAALNFSFTFTVVYDENVAFCLSEILYAVIIFYLAICMWERRSKDDPLAIEPPPIDAFANLKFFIEEQSKNVDYLAPGGALRNDAATLNGCMEARLKNRHSGHMATFNNWEIYLNDIINLLHIFGDKVRATAVEKIRHVLIDARTNGTIVTDSLFPELFQ